MAIEIERKFLVTGDFRKEAETSLRITQGYLSSAPERSVRVRISGDMAFLTIKGAGNESGTSRFEWETQIPVDDARQLMNLCEAGVIDKTRYIVPAGKHRFEVDVFHGDNEGLVVAEIELCSENESFERPSWLGKEVTAEAKYYNSMLSRHPFRKW